jgi:hypothetical protein
MPRLDSPTLQVPRGAAVASATEADPIPSSGLAGTLVSDSELVDFLHTLLTRSTEALSASADGVCC